MVKKVIDIQPKTKKKKESCFSLPSEEKKFKKKSSCKKGLFLLGIVLFILFFFLFSFNLGRLKIKIRPKIEIFTFNEKVFLSKDVQSIDFGKKILPAKNFEIEEEFSDEFLTSGKIKKEKRAQGVVRIFNNSNIDQVLVANTRLQAPLEKFKTELAKNENPWFRTTERVIVPAKGYIDVKVIADAPGEKYNIEASTFSIPGLLGTPQYTLVHGKSTEPMKGGMIKEVAQITKEDIQKADKELTIKSETEIIEILKKKVPPDFELVPETIKIEVVEKKSLALAGEEKEKFTYQIKIKANALSFSKKDAVDFIQKELSNAISSEKEILAGTLEYKWKREKTEESLTEKISLLFEISVKIYDKIDFQKLKEKLKGLSVEKAKNFLQHQPEIEKALIEVFPFWLRNVPKRNEKIEILYPFID